MSPHVPVLLGARATDRNFRRIVEWADGWMPMGSSNDVEGIAGDVAELRRRWADAGRPGSPEGCYFARKFDLAADPGTLDWLDDQVLA